MDTPFVTLWEVWRDINYTIFQDKQIDVVHVCTMVLSILKEYGCGIKNNPDGVIKIPSLDYSVVTCFFLWS